MALDNPGVPEIQNIDVVARASA